MGRSVLPIAVGKRQVLCELVDVAVRRTEVHPAIAALVFLGQQNLDPVGPKLIGDRPDVVYEEAGNRTGREWRFMSSLVRRPRLCCRRATSARGIQDGPVRIEGP